jgi:hypothetical protein
LSKIIATISALWQLLSLSASKTLKHASNKAGFPFCLCASGDGKRRKWLSHAYLALSDCAAAIGAGRSAFVSPKTKRAPKRPFLRLTGGQIRTCG